MKLADAHVRLRADASTAIGVGHVMRSLTLGAELVRRGALVSLASDAAPDELRGRALDHGIAVVAADGGPPADLTVVDGYHLGAELERLVRLPGLVAVIDDNAELSTSGVDVVLNQNAHAHDVTYPSADPSRYLLGLEYALVRADVRAAARGRGKADTATVLIVLGGSDPTQLTRRLATAVVQHTDLGVVVGIGPANPDRPALEELAGAEPRVEIDPGDLTAAYRDADIAIIGAGSTMWEVAHVGIPAIALVVADNQAAASGVAATHGVVDVLDARQGIDPRGVAAAAGALHRDADRREAMAAAGRSLVDGLGAARVASALEEVLAARGTDPVVS